MALTANSTIGEWLNHPTGGDLVRGLLAQSGADPESLTPVLGLPLQQLVYRQVMYLVVVQSVVTAVIGNRLRWQRMVRTGEAAALAGVRPGAPVNAAGRGGRPY